MKNLIPAIVAGYNPTGKQHGKYTHKVQHPTAKKFFIRQRISKHGRYNNAQRSPHNGDNNRHQVSLSYGFPGIGNIRVGFQTPGFWKKTESINSGPDVYKRQSIYHG